MSISGMTGFARAEGAHGGVRWVWEAKSVNGRALDMKLRLPPGFDGLEPAARAAASARFKRGSLQASLSIARDAGETAPVKIDLKLVERFLQAGETFGDRVEKPRWDGMLALKGVLSAEDDVIDEGARTSLDAALLASLNAALDGLNEARRAEGRMLASALTQLADRLDAGIAAARSSAAAAPAAIAERIRTRLAALSADVQLDPQRLAQEAAVVASKADVQEEVDRLAAHAGELRALLKSAEPVGRKLDFLGQELTREANTLCSKSGDLDLTRIGLDLKAVVDQIKEQAANAE
ncbi:protein YicC [alpha proteobacterium U9-1i]|nr:protein YicC [alpha proteobacterium U9-1i]